MIRWVQEVAAKTGALASVSAVAIVFGRVLKLAAVLHARCSISVVFFSLAYCRTQARLFLPGLLQSTGQALLRIKWCIAIECSYLHTDLFGTWWGFWLFEFWIYILLVPCTTHKGVF